jgi:hypothetical protein
MFTNILKKWKAVFRQNKPQTHRKHSVRLGVEQLETRLTPANVDLGVYGLLGGGWTPPTDMTALAKLFTPTPSASTHLYLNFDGYSDSIRTVSPYKANALFSGTATQQINEIIFEVSEIFSPFNVEVSRIYGKNNYATTGAITSTTNSTTNDGLQPETSTTNGPTTIFVGDNSANSTTYSNHTVNNLAASGTPFVYSDFPGQNLGNLHNFHSNDFNIAFVDPIGQDPTGNNTSFTLDQTAEAIAHEAGHTFGLGHVRTDGLADPAKLSGTGPVHDIMSYNLPNQYFADTTLPITSYNYTPNPKNPSSGTTQLTPSVVPTFNGTAMTTQDSFTFLEQVLGDRRADGNYHVVHDGFVDPAHFTAPFTNITHNSTVTGVETREGDYQVYWMDPNSNYKLTVNLTRINGVMDPVLFVYNQGNLIAYHDNHSVAGTANSAITVTVNAGQAYAFVVGEYGGNVGKPGVDAYKLTISSFALNTITGQAGRSLGPIVPGNPTNVGPGVPVESVGKLLTAKDLGTLPIPKTNVVVRSGILLPPTPTTVSVRINASALGTPLYVDGTLEPTSTVTINLLPGRHTFFTTGGSTQFFDVAANGALTLENSRDGSVVGNTLTITGLVVSIDASDLGTPLYLNGLLEPTSAVTVNLLPGRHSFCTTSGSSQYFDIADNGAISLEDPRDGVVNGNNISITGIAVVIDATALGAGLYLDGILQSGPVTTADLLPGSHSFCTADGTSQYFDIADDGTMTLQSARNGMIAGNTLTLTGIPVTIDASALETPLYLDGVIRSEKIVNVNLLVGRHSYISNGATQYFYIADDGTISLANPMTGTVADNTITIV